MRAYSLVECLFRHFSERLVLSVPSRSLDTMSNHAEGPVTVQEVKERHRWLVTTQVTTNPTPSLTRPVARENLRELIPRPEVVLARLRDYPVVVERGRENGYTEALARIGSGDAELTDGGGAWFAMDTAELRRHFDEDTVNDVAFCYEWGWMQGWDEYRLTQTS